MNSENVFRLETCFEKLKEDYLLKKSKPLIVNEHKRLFVFYGLPCAGKTTLSKLLKEKENVIRVSTDLLRSQFIPLEQQFKSKEQSIQLFELMIKYIDYLLSQGESVVCEGLFIALNRKEQLLDVSIKNNTRCFFFYIKASLKILNSRLEERKTSGMNSELTGKELLTSDILRSLVELSYPPKQKKIIIDTTYDEVMTSEKLILKLIKNNIAIKKLDELLYQ